METRKKNIRIVMLPWLAHGHICPFLELAKALSKRNFITYLFTTPVNLTFFKQRLSPIDSIRIKLMEIQLPNLPQLPPHYHTTNGLPPHLMNTLKKAFLMSKPDFFTILDTLKPDLIIYDFLQPCIPTMAATLNIPAVLFLTPGAASNSYHYHRRNNNPSLDYPFREIFFRDYEHRKNKKIFDSLENDGIDEKNGVTRCFERSHDIILIKTFKELEGKYIDYLSILFKKKFVLVGPLVREIDQEDGEKHCEIIEWLNEKEKCSTIFVSFGSECFLSNEEIEELALGLELSMVNFIWVVRFPMGEKRNILEVLPKGYFERVENRGIVIEGWAPQERILEHSSIGGFVSHCGWSSVMEGLNYSVPIIAMPMQHDQPLNARLLVNEVRVGMEIHKDEEGNLGKEEVARIVREVVFEKSGERLREKAKEFSEIMRENGENDIHEVVEELYKLCKKTLRHNYYLGKLF